MSRCDLVLSGGRVLLTDGVLADVDIGISNGKIAEIGAHGTISDALETLDMRGLVALPGVLDAHIHLGHGRDITRPRVASDADTETASAAAGGVTSFISYVIASEPYENGLFDEVVRVTKSGARIDFGFHCVISTEEQLAALPMYVEQFGVTSFKLFMYNRGGEGARLGLPDIDDGFLYRLAESIRKADAVLCPHCENIEVAWLLRERLIVADPEGLGGLGQWCRSRPGFLEAEAVHRVCTIGRSVGTQVHMVHCSSADGLEAAVTQRSLGARLSIETCAQYLTHDVDWPGGAKAKVNPPVRYKADVEALWEGVKTGAIDTVATDHVHRDITAKSGGIWVASPGFPGLETLLPVMLTEGYHKRNVPLGRISALLSGNPARIMGCAGKGAIAIGSDADFALVDLDVEWVADEAAMRSDAGFSIYDDWTFKGRVVHTLVRGGFVLRDRELCPDAIGTGAYLFRRRGRDALR